MHILIFSVVLSLFSWDSSTFRYESRASSFGDRTEIGTSNSEIRRSEDIGSKRWGNYRIPESRSRSYSDRYPEECAENIGTEERYSGILTLRDRVSTGPRISKYISYQEATYSKVAIRYGIKNVPSEEQLKNMTNLGINFFDKVRIHFGKPLYISSFFRNKELNTKVKGAIYSDHMALKGEAGIDIDMDGRSGPTNNELFHYIRKNMPFYKLIVEFPANGKPSWIHVSYSQSPIKNNEKYIFIAVNRNNRTVYLPYKGNEHLVK